MANPSPGQPPQNPYSLPPQMPVYNSAPTGNEAAATVIPYRNVCALIGYYCGIFSLIPCLGAILGPVAFVLGIIGFIAYLKNPAVHGSVHAWIGIIIGGGSFALHLLLFLMPFLTRM